ncbi:hypothetical protein J7M23_07545 [Candidatus Sumerlaeota bacterium]|nr:hypothetical protein [Candidatus Sumerlaeota bacterium]
MNRNAILLVILSILFSGIYLHCFSETCDIYEPFVSADSYIFSSGVEGIRLADSPPPGPPLREPDMVWVNNALSSMTLEEKIVQMIVTSFHSSGESLIDQYKGRWICFSWK